MDHRGYDKLLTKEVGGGGCLGAVFLIYEGPDGISFREFIFIYGSGLSRSILINCTLFLQNRFDR